jgi:mono/diheme cytochrome c family protein
MKTLIAFIAGLIAGPVLLIVAGLVGFIPSKSTSAPPGWENELGEKLLDTALEHRSSGLRNPVRPSDAAALAAGMELYSDNCAGCHGDSTGPSPWGSKNFYPRVPQFWQFAGEEQERVTPEEAYAAIHDGIRYTGMGAWSGMMKEDDMWKVANFIARIHDLPPELKQQVKTAG